MTSIWKEEVNTGLCNELLSNVKYKGKNNKLVPVDLVLVRVPEEEFKPEKFPCVSIYSLDDVFSTQRYNPSPRIKSIDKPSHSATMQEAGLPFNLRYQIDFWSKYQEDMDNMTMTWLSGHFRQFNLPVMNDRGNKTTCNCLMNGKVVTSDLISGSERIFHKIFRYTIWVEIDQEKTYNTNIVTDVNVSAYKKD